MTCPSEVPRTVIAWPTFSVLEARMGPTVRIGICCATAVEAAVDMRTMSLCILMSIERNSDLVVMLSREAAGSLSGRAVNRGTRQHHGIAVPKRESRNERRLSDHDLAASSNEE